MLSEVHKCFSLHNICKTFINGGPTDLLVHMDLKILCSKQAFELFLVLFHSQVPFSPTSNYRQLRHHII